MSVLGETATDCSAWIVLRCGGPLITTAEPPNIVAVISDGAFPTGKQFSEDISRHYLYNPRTNFLVRLPFLLRSTPGAAGATALVYYVRSGSTC